MRFRKRLFEKEVFYPGMTMVHTPNLQHIVYRGLSRKEKRIVTEKKYDESDVAFTPDITQKRQVRAEKITPFETARFLLKTGCLEKGRCSH